MVIEHHRPLPAQFLDGFQKLIVLLFEIAESRRDQDKYKVYTIFTSIY